MKKAFVPRFDILPPAQRRLWPVLGPVVRHGFVLYGGTAVALRCGHRTSVDFDFFGDRPLDVDPLTLDLPFLLKAQVLQNTENTLTVSVLSERKKEKPVKISFFGSIGFGRVDAPEWTEDGVLQVASPLDLMGTKLAVLLKRVVARDYQDIAALIRSGVSLNKGLAVAQVLYGFSFQPSEALKALVYFKGGDLSTLPRLDRQLLVEAVKKVGPLPVIRSVSKKLGLSPRPVT